jgi:hypothetical protein
MSMAQRLRAEAWAKLVAALSASSQRVKDSLYGHGVCVDEDASSTAARRGFAIGDWALRIADEKRPCAASAPATAA